MNKLIAISALLLSFSSVQAQPVRMVSSDGSMLSALCIAAVNSTRPVYETAAIHGILRQKIEQIRCNGIPLQRFVSKFKSRYALGSNDRAGNANSITTTSRQ